MMALRRLRGSVSAASRATANPVSFPRRDFSGMIAIRDPASPVPAFIRKSLVRFNTNTAVTQSVFSPFKAVRLGKQKGHLWRTRKQLSREAQLLVGELVRHRENKARLERIFTVNLRRVLKIDMLGILGELQREKQPLLALRVFHEMKKEPWYKPDILQYAALMGCLAKTRMTKEAEALFEELKEDKLEPELNNYTELLRALIFSRQVERVHQTVREMKDNGCPPDLIAYKVLWVGLNAIGHHRDAAIYRNELTEAQTRCQVERVKENSEEVEF